MAAARITSLTSLDAASRASSMSGGSRCSQRRQVLALVAARDRLVDFVSQRSRQFEIGRVLESGTLSSAQLRRILEYLGRAAADRREDLKEYTIGVEALGKPPSYDPQKDSTVRVQVGKQGLAATLRPIS
jgi:hypothetical protein